MHFRAIDERPLPAPRPRVPRLLPVFAALSLLIHGLLFIPGGETPPRLQPLGATYIRAILSSPPAGADGTHQTEPHQPAKPPAEATTPPAGRARATPRQARPAPAPAPTWSVEPEPPALPADPATPPAAKPPEPRSGPPARAASASRQPAPTASGTPADTRPGAGEAEPSPDAERARHNYLLGQLQDQLSRYLSYPLRARRRGWEGEVLLGLRLAADGRLSDIHLLRSSGYPVLDRSALRALHQLERLRLPGDAPPLQPTRLTLPVIYRLSAS